MLRGFYTAASGILSQQRTLEVLTNNIANIRTPGFRASRVVKSPFEMELLARMEENETKSAVIGSSAPMQLVSEVPVKFDTSALQETGRALDFAIDGEGFLNIVGPADAADNPGVQYLTRNGSFALNENKQLELVGAGLVLGEKGVIELKDADFTVEPDGSIYDSRGRYIDRLLVTVPAEGSQTRIAGNGLYLTDNMQANQSVSAQTKIRQGWLETSNVDINREYAMVMEAQRAFQACSSALQIIDKIDQKSASQIAAL